MKHLLGDSQLNFLAGINVLVVLCAVATTGARFIDPYNLQSMAGQVPELGLLAMGVMLAMISGNGGIDLSGIALGNLAAVSAGTLVPQWIAAAESPVAFTAVFAGITIAIGVAGGLVNGVLIAYWRLPAILCTLGTQLVYTGIAVVISSGSAVRIGYNDALDYVGNGVFLGVPVCFLLFVGVALLVGIWLRFSAGGLRLGLMGTNLKAASYAGIAHRRLILLTYTTCGVLAALAGLVIAARSSSAKWDYGSSYVLIAILIAVMAGVRPEGGYGRMTCLVLSATALQFLSSTFNFIEISSFFRDLAWGVLLLTFIASSRMNLRTLFETRPARPASLTQASTPAATPAVE
jgi:simple sugar transport system permease protein